MPGRPVVPSGVVRVTLAEFLQHVLVSTGVMSLGVAVMAYVRFRYDVGHRTFKRTLGWFAASVALVAVLSRTATVTERRCTRDLLEFCRYNDNIPFMVVVVFLFLAGCGIRAFFLHFSR